MAKSKKIARKPPRTIKRAREGKQPRARKAPPRRLERAAPLPDNPLLRHMGVAVDRLSGADDVKLTTLAEGLRVAVAAADLKLARAGKQRKPAKDSARKQLAEMRLAALEQSRSMPGAFEGAPVVAAPALHAEATLGTEATGVELVPPMPGTSNWVQMGPTAIPKGQTYGGARVLVTGRVTAIVVDPTDKNVIYLGTAQGGVWKTIDGGKNWIAKTDNEVSLAIGALAMDPGNPLVLYAGTGEGNFSGDSYYGNGVLKTTDGGNTWTALATATFTGTRFGRIAVTPGTPTQVFAATGNGVYRSTNGGTTWTKMTSGLPGFAAATDVVIDPTTPTSVYAAFWGQGIYKTTTAGAATPTWTKLSGGLPTSGFTRIALGLSPSSPQTVYALIANTGYTINQFYRTTNGGTSWSPIALPGGNIGGQGFYNLDVAVDPTTPDIVYLSGISVWKATRNPVTGAWTITQIGANIHPDNHAFAFDPTNHLVIYAGNDGGIYKSNDAGAAWDDSINEGPCITQFEFISQHPSSDAVVFGGTQDNGTEQFRNSPVFYHADDGDGGFCAIDPNQPRNVISTYYSPSPKRSTQGGKFATWFGVSAGIVGGGLFYPPLTLDQTNPNNIAIGTDRINLDAAQGTGGWPAKVSLPGLSGSVSAIDYVNSNLIYVGTSSGQVYRLTKSGTAWTATAIHAAPLPGAFIWDIAARPGDPNTVILVMSGFGISHVWRGAVPASATATWTNISGSGAGTLPDIPTNAVAIEPAAPDTMYVATDIAVYRTTNGGTTWTQFSQALPNCAVYDMKLHHPSRLLRVGTHGRGMWERRLDVASTPNVDLFFRDHLMHTGRVNPSPSNVPAAFEDPLNYVNLGDILNWWMCADIKVDALEGSPPAYHQTNVADVDYARYESKLQHRNAQRGNVNRVYVQVHNRGIMPAADVVVKLLYANASPGLPPLPPDFWTAFPGDSSNTTIWHPIGSAKTIVSLSPTEPTILQWDWSTPSTAADHTCLLVVMDCPSDPIPAANKIFDVNNLVRAEKRVGLKNLHVVNAVPGASLWAALRLFSQSAKAQTIKILPSRLSGWSVSLVLPKSATFKAASKPSKASKKSPKASASAPALDMQPNLLVAQKPTKGMIKSLKDKVGKDFKRFDSSRIFSLASAEKGGALTGLRIPKRGLRTVLFLTPPQKAGKAVTFSIVQEDDGEVVGGNTFVLRAIKVKQ